MKFQPLKYIYRPSVLPEANTLLLFHGTGGDEEDLLDIATYLDKDVNVLSLRGNVLENGMPRFFRRVSPGKFDEQDLAHRSDEVLVFLRQLAKTEGFNINKIIALGYSNGANILGSILLRNPDFLLGAILFRPMRPYRLLPAVRMRHACPVFLSSGMSDSTVDLKDTESYCAALSDRGFLITWHRLKSGHGLSKDDVNLAAQWYFKHFG